MAPTPRNNHALGEAGLHTQRASTRERGRRYFKVEDSVKGHGCPSYVPGDHAKPNAFCKDTTARTKDDYCGLSSVELCKVHDLHHRRGRRHLAPRNLLAKTPSTPSLASEPVSEESQMLHLGHREKVRDERWKDLLEQDAFAGEEPCGGVSSHHLSARKGKLGYGRRRFGPECKWVGYHRARAINDPGGEDAFSQGNFLGAQKKSVGGRRFYDDDLFGDTIDVKEFHTKKMFKEKIQEAVHATEEIPIGVSSQIDLHTRGFLGKSKHNFGGMAQLSSDPITDRSAEPPDPNDLSSYGLSHRGKRKFLVQSNLDTGCRHNLSKPESKSVATIRSASAPVLERELPPNQTPYFQDDLPDEMRATKKELGACCQLGTEFDRDMKPRSCIPVTDNAWSCLTWTPRKVDQMTAAKFVEGQDQIHLVTDEEHREAEFRNHIGETKRSFGNAHNKSQFRFDYCDDPTWKTEHIAIVKQDLDFHCKMPKRPDAEMAGGGDEDGAPDPKTEMRSERERIVERTLPWGEGRGRRKFKIADHLEDADDGCEPYLSFWKDKEHRWDAKPESTPVTVGVKLGRVNPLKPEDHNLWDRPAEFVPPRNVRPPKDNVDELFDCEVQSEDSNTMAVTGMRRRTEPIRPHSQNRRFPEKDAGRPTRSVTPPRTRSEASLPLSARPMWKK